MENQLQTYWSLSAYTLHPVYCFHEKKSKNLAWVKAPICAAEYKKWSPTLRTIGLETLLPRLHLYYMFELLGTLPVTNKVYGKLTD